MGNNGTNPMGGRLASMVLAAAEAGSKVTGKALAQVLAKDREELTTALLNGPVDAAVGSALDKLRISTEHTHKHAHELQVEVTPQVDVTVDLQPVGDALGKLDHAPAVLALAEELLAHRQQSADALRQLEVRAEVAEQAIGVLCEQNKALVASVKAVGDNLAVALSTAADSLVKAMSKPVNVERDADGHLRRLRR